MGLEKIRKKILEDSREEAGRILKEAREKEDWEIKKALKKIKEKEDVKLKKGTVLAEQEKQRAIAQALMDAKKEKKRLQTQAIDEILEKTGKKLAQAGKNKKYPKLLEKLVSETSEELKGKIEIEIRKKDARYLKKCKKRAFKETLKTTGLIANSDQGVRIDCTLKNMLKEKEGQIRAKLQEELEKAADTHKKV